MRNNNHRFLRSNGKFIIFRESSGIIEPRKSTFNNPTPGKFFPLIRLDFFRNIYIFLSNQTQMFPYIQHLRRIFVCSDNLCRLLLQWIYRSTESIHPRTSTTICRFLPFVFFPHQFLVLHSPALFLHFVSQYRIARTLLASGINSRLFYYIL